MTTMQASPWSPTLPMPTHAMKNASLLLDLPKELVFQIITHAAIATCNDSLYPLSLNELSKCNHELYHLIHHDPWRLKTLWPRTFHERFDTRAIYRRRLHGWDWQKVMKLRCMTLYACKAFADQPTTVALLDNIRWELIWDMITEHDERNMSHILNYKVHAAAVAAYQLDQYRDRQLFSVILPILSLLVNYDFTITSHFRAPVIPGSAQIVSTELSQFAYNFEAADSLIIKHIPPRPFHVSSRQHVNEPPSLSDNELALMFYPALDASVAALHLFFATFFASHPSLYTTIPGCIPIPLFQINSTMFDVEYLRRYERNLFINAAHHYNNNDDNPTRHRDRTCTENVTTLPSTNIYSDTGFASPSHFVSEAHQIAGDWLGYYSFVDPEEDVTTGVEDWFDGPMRLSIWIVPLDDGSNNNSNSTGSSILISSSSATIATMPLTMTLASTSSTLLALTSFTSPASPTISISASSLSLSSPSLHLSAFNTTLPTSWPSRWSSIENTNKRHIDHEMRLRKQRRHSEDGKNSFPRMHLQTCPLTKFEGTGADNLGNFTVVGLIDDTEDGQVTWEKTYVESGETWEYSGKFALPMGICGRWGDEEYGGPWWIWKTSDSQGDSTLSASSVNIK